MATRRKAGQESGGAQNVQVLDSFFHGIPPSDVVYFRREGIENVPWSPGGQIVTILDIRVPKNAYWDISVLEFFCDVPTNPTGPPYVRAPDDFLKGRISARLEYSGAVPTDISSELNNGNVLLPPGSTKVFVYDELNTNVLDHGDTPTHLVFSPESHIKVMASVTSLEPFLPVLVPGTKLGAKIAGRQISKLAWDRVTRTMYLSNG